MPLMKNINIMPILTRQFSGNGPRPVWLCLDQSVQKIEIVRLALRIIISMALPVFLDIVLCGYVPGGGGVSCGAHGGDGARSRSAAGTGSAHAHCSHAHHLAMHIVTNII